MLSDTGHCVIERLLICFTSLKVGPWIIGYETMVLVYSFQFDTIFTNLWRRTTNQRCFKSRGLWIQICVSLSPWYLVCIDVGPRRSLAICGQVGKDPSFYEEGLRCPQERMPCTEDVTFTLLYSSAPSGFLRRGTILQDVLIRRG